MRISVGIGGVYFSTVRKRLLVDGRSQFRCVGQAEMKAKHLLRFESVPWVEARCRKMHSQWVMVNREMADCLMEDDFTAEFEGMEVPDEHYIGSVLAMKGYPLDDSHVYHQDATWMRWHENLDVGTVPVEVLHIEPTLRREWLDFPGFFARKVSPFANLEI